MDLAIGQQRSAGPIRREELFGRQHWVVPAVAVQEQVLENNVGRMFLPADEIRASVNAWDFTPVTLGHPTSRGQPRSARDPDVVNSRVVGIVFNASFEDDALKVDVFIDPDQARNVAGGEKLLAQLQRGEVGEVSTGFAFQAENKSGEFGGEEFDLIARNLQPDHFAVGVEEGACGVEDGCGLGINVRSSARTPTFSGTTEEGWNAPGLGDFTDESWSNLSDDEKQSIVETTLLGEVEDTFSDSFVFPVVEPSGELNRNALNAVRSVARGGRGGADVPEAAADSAFDKAGQLLEEEFDVDVDNADAENVADTIWERLKAYLSREQTMDTEQIAELSEATGLDEDFITEMEPDAQEALAANVLEDGDDEPKPDDDTAQNARPGEDTPEWAENLVSEVESLREDVDEVREAAEPAVDEYREEHGNLVNRLANNQDCPFGEDDLEEKSLDELRKLDQMAKNRDYGARGGPRSDPSDLPELGFEVGDPWSEPAEA